LQLIAEGELHGGLDWVAVQRLKATGLVEEQTKGLVLTAEGRKALSRVLSRSS
jgi:ribosomal protein S19E (S16A)